MWAVYAATIYPLVFVISVEIGMTYLYHPLYWKRDNIVWWYLKYLPF